MSKRTRKTYFALSHAFGDTVQRAKIFLELEDIMVGLCGHITSYDMEDFNIVLRSSHTENGSPVMVANDQVLGALVTYSLQSGYMNALARIGSRKIINLYDSRGNLCQKDLAGSMALDGTVFAGYSLYKGSRFFSTSEDASPLMGFNRASKYVKMRNNNNYLGHSDWRMPTKSELSVLFNNQSVIGGFKLNILDPGYVSSTVNKYDEVLYQYFSDGSQMYAEKDVQAVLRMVRG